MDSGCSQHVTGERSMFLNFQIKDGGHVIFGGNQKGKITRVGRISISSLTSIDNVLFVEGLKHNLLNISQLCGNGYDVNVSSKMLMDNYSLLLRDRIIFIRLGLLT